MTRHAPPPEAEGVGALGLTRLALAAIAEILPSGEDGDGGEPGDIRVLEIGDAVRQARRNPSPADEGLVRLAERLRLGDAELLAVAVLIAVELDPQVCRSIALCQRGVAGPRPSIGLLATAFQSLGPVDDLVLDLATGRAMLSGCMRLAGEDAPLPERTLAIARPVLAALRGRDDPPAGVVLASPGSGVPLPPSVQEALAARLAAARAAGGAALLALRGRERAELDPVAAAAAASLGLRLATVTGPVPDGLAAWLAAADAVPLFRLHAPTGERVALPAVPCHEGLTIVAVTGEGAFEGPAGPVPTWRPPLPDAGEREALWQAGGLAPALARTLALSFRHGPAAIARHASAIRAAGGTPADAAAVVTRDLDPAIEGLALRLDGRVSDAGFVASPDLGRGLERLLAHCRARELLGRRLGPALSERYRPGVRALFYGPPGAGKSLAAQWIATRLGLPVYRVDLAAVTSKWIGETEKNLARLLDSAETGNALLLFDEADTLFGARTDVTSSNDRFANAQTNYLLQRLESHDGIIILTSNVRDRVDSGFTRRLDAILAFPLPDARQRRLIWAAHLGPHALGEADLNRVASLVELAGGHIRNIVVAATAAAVGAEEPVSLEHVLDACAAEYGKLGRPLPPELSAR